MIQGKKINNIVIKPIKKQEEEELPIKGYEYFEEPYCNVFLCAKKKSGKTTVVYNILKACISKNTKVHIFASTVFRDPAYKNIVEYLEKHKIQYEIYTSIVDEGQNIVKQIIDELNEEAATKVEKEEEEEEENKKETSKYDAIFAKPKVKKSTIRKPKFLAPEHFFIFDDLGSTLRDKSIDSIMKVNRHYKSKIIISSQYLNDLSPQAKQQLDYMLVFKGLPIDKLESIHKSIDLSVPFEIFLKYYQTATEIKYDFLYIDIRNDKFRINFNIELSQDNISDSEND